MIISFGDKETENFYETGESAEIPINIQERLKEQLDFLDEVSSFQQLKEAPRGYRLHKLKGDLKDLYSISVNMKYRAIFNYDGRDAHIVELTNHYK